MREKSDCREVWLFLLVSGLNYLNGGKHAARQTFEPSGIQSKILGFLRERVDRFLDQSFRIELFDWVSFLKTRSLSYTGEEVRSAKWTNWYHIAPALPRGCVGSIPALDLAEGGIHAYRMPTFLSQTCSCGLIGNLHRFLLLALWCRMKNGETWPGA